MPKVTKEKPKPVVTSERISSPRGVSAESVTPPLPAKRKLYEKYFDEGKEFGLKATDFIQVGTLILAERPIIRIPHDAWLKDPKFEIDSLTAAQRNHLKQQPSPDPHPVSGSDESEVGLEIDKEIRKFQTNSFHLDVGQMSNSQRVVFNDISWLGHSCAPNAFHSYQKSVRHSNYMCVRARKNIEPGQIISIDYLNYSGWPGRQERADALATKPLDVRCQCVLCSDTEIARASAGRRSKLNDFLENAVPRADRTNSHKRKALVEKYVDLAEQEVASIAPPSNTGVSQTIDPRLADA